MILCISSLSELVALNERMVLKCGPFFWQNARAVTGVGYLYCLECVLCFSHVYFNLIVVFVTLAVYNCVVG